MRSYEAYMKSPYASNKHSTYFNVYDRIFTPFVGTKIVFVEVGVFSGGSLFMWRDFFGPNARIIGIDLNPAAKQWENDGFEIYIGNQSDPIFWKKFFAMVGRIDILLDDGGHTFEQQIITAVETLPYINDGGLLVVEDTHTSYSKEFGGPSSLSFISYAKNIIDGINFRFVDLRPSQAENAVFSIQFFEFIVVFEVDRKLCAIRSEWANNRGKSANMIDFRFADFSPRQRLELTSKKLSFIKNVPLVGLIARATYRVLVKTIIYYVELKKRLNLRKYFKFVQRG